MSVDELRRAREESANVAYQTFFKHIREDKNGLFCFFEGKDSPYYRLRIVNVFKGSYFPIMCKGKSKVLKAYELISRHEIYDKYKKCFFIDSDFDPPLHNPKIYETPCYSIENHYTSVAVFGEIIKSEWILSEIDEDYKRCMVLYEDLQAKFHTAIQLFNAWYACLIDKKHESGNEIKSAKLKDAPPTGFINIQLDGVSSNYDITKIRTKYPEAFAITNEEISAKLESFKSQDKRLIFRGKYELNFMLVVMEELLKDASAKTANKDRKYFSKSIKYNITHPRAIGLFSQYAETPPELLQYIQSCIN